MTLLEVEHLRKTYKTGHGLRHGEPFVAVDDMSFTLEHGKTLAIVGESGAGKSTTGSLILRLIEPDSGSVRLAGTDVMALDEKQLRVQRRKMQMIFQDPQSSLDPRIAIVASVAEPLKIHFGMNRTDRERKAAQLLSTVGLGRESLHKFPHEMSGGQLQRAAIARALTLDPVLLVCDEAVSALDVSIRAQVLNLLVELQAELDLAYVFISHDLLVVEAIAHDVAVMQHGKLVELGPSRQIYENPREPYTRELLSAVLFPDPTLRQHARDTRAAAKREPALAASSAGA